MTSAKIPVMYNYDWPGRVKIGAGAVNTLPDYMALFGGKHAFVLIDPGVRPFMLDTITAPLHAAGYTTTPYDKVIPNPDVPHTDAAAAAYRESGADVIIGVGGGSALDMGKGVRVLAGADPAASSRQYMSSNPDAKPMPAIRDMPEMFAVPTTAGTGSEVTPWGVITDPETHRKGGIGGVSVIPSAAICDPELTYGLPNFLTAATGVDTLSHLIEAYISIYAIPTMEEMILRGIRLVGENLRQATAEPHDLTARHHMMEAAMLGGIAISSSYVGSCHSLAHQLSTFADMHHGLACGIMLPPQMNYLLSAAPEKYLRIAQALNPRATDAAEAPQAVHQLLVDCGLPTKLSDAGVNEEVIDTMADNAMIDGNWMCDPIAADEAKMAELYRAVY